jgi:[NiFe] hydrogenase assembly HybE family chaperone
MTTDADMDAGDRVGTAGVTGRAALGPRPDPAPALVAAARAAAARMAGLAFVNPALAVEAVGFAPWNGHWLGVLLTPWSMNLVLAPRDRAAWPDVARGAKLRLRFPAGDYDFVGARDDDAGETLVCSLFSPVLEFEDQATARLVAELAREALFDPEHAEAADGLPANGATEGARPLAAIERSLDAPLSRRDLLRGRFKDGSREP